MPSKQYGHQHQLRRATLLRKYRAGDICPRCLKPMLAGEKLDAAHPIGNPFASNPYSVADHLEHASCNRKAWAEYRGPKSPRYSTRAPLKQSRDW